MTDDAYERLAQRNAELEAEKTALAEELEHTQGERDALAAYVETALKLVGWFSRVRVGSVDGVPLYAHQIDAGVERDVIAFLGCSPESSKRALEAAAIDSLVPRVADEIGRTLDLSEDQIIEVEDWLGGHAELRRESGASECRCTFAQKTVGDGCAACNPELPSNWEVGYE